MYKMSRQILIDNVTEVKGKLLSSSCVSKLLDLKKKSDMIFSKTELFSKMKLCKSLDVHTGSALQAEARISLGVPDQPGLHRDSQTSLG